MRDRNRHENHGHERGDQGNDHGHSHATLVDDELTTHRAAVRAIWISVVGLGLTAAFQLGIVAISGSAGLFADALHNVGDVAGTAALWIGFKLSRRPASVRFTYGWRRSEDLAGLFILVAIAVSAGLAGWDSLSALLSPGHVVRNTGAAFAAALVGAVGNEAVAIYKIRVGRRIDSVPLIADGQHARVDGFVSLGAAAGLVGVWLGFPIADPLAGLIITALIVGVMVRTGRDVLTRNLDGIDGGLVQRIHDLALGTTGVEGVHDVRARHAGRTLLVQLHIEVDCGLRLREAHDIAEAVRHQLVHEFPAAHEVDVHLDPADTPDAHAAIAHHFAAETDRWSTGALPSPGAVQDPPQGAT